MPNYNLSPYMNLPVPEVGVEAGPQYANDINNCMTLVDQHNHTTGSGVQIPTSGLNINSDLAINSNNLTLIRSVRFNPQGMPLSGASDLDCVYTAGVDLYYNDGNGNQVRITQSGSLAGTPGSIANLSTPASASYVSLTKTFVWQSNVNTAANLDAGSVTIRPITASANGVTLSPPNSVPSNYTLTLPSLPSANSFLSIDTSGNIGSISQTGGIIGTNLAANTVAQSNLYIRTTGTSVSAGNVAVSTSCGTFNTTSTAYVNITNLSVTLVTTGRPVMLLICPDASGLPFLYTVSSNQSAVIGINNGSSVIQASQFTNSTTSPSIPNFTFLDTPSPGTITYTAQIKLVAGGALTLEQARLIAYEL